MASCEVYECTNEGYLRKFGRYISVPSAWNPVTGVAASGMVVLNIHTSSKSPSEYVLKPYLITFLCSIHLEAFRAVLPMQTVVDRKGVRGVEDIYGIETER